MSDQETEKPVDELLVNVELKSNTVAEIDKTILENIIGTVGQSEPPSEPVEAKDDQVAVDKTNETDNSDQTNSKKSRELKLLLALSKEANLETNISHKRHSLEGNKVKDKDVLKTGTSPVEPDVKKKLAHDSKNVRYPVTAESELELDASENVTKDMDDNSGKPLKNKRDSLNEVSTGGATEEFGKRNKKLSENMARFKPNKDIFCWRCHREGVNIACETCPRSYHQKCLKQTIHDTEHWPCPECVSILKAESTQTRSPAMKGMSLEHLCSLLKFAANRMIQCHGSEPFLHPVSDTEFPDYKKYIIQPMDLTEMEKNIKGNLYGSTQAFEADAKWLLHNSIIYNSYQSKLTSTAKTIVKICKQEMAEIENCPSCYLNANTKKDTWFVEVCPKPHLLVWAKLKGFPFWPAKAMCTNSAGMVDVRFFGAHDRAWVHYKDCYLYSERDPNTFKQKRYEIERCVAEVNIYVENLRKVYGEFKYAPFKTPLEPENEVKQLQMFLPKYKSSSHRKKSHNKNHISTKTDSTEHKTQETNFTSKFEIREKNKDSSSIKNDENKSNLETKTDSPEEVKKTDTETSNLDINNDNTDINQNGSCLKVNGISPSNVSQHKRKRFDDESIMEGYGTDDDATTEISFGLKKPSVEEKTDRVTQKNAEVSQDEDEEDDTQVPSNISISISSVDKDKIQEDVSQPENSQSSTKTIHDSNYISQKRQSTEETVQSVSKIARRNSDLNVKSDVTLLPSLSEKINRVDIPEDMEVTLSNSSRQVCLSISENVSPELSDSEISTSSEQFKKKPVQVDIENTEFTISPTNKLKMSDQLIKRLSDADENVPSDPKVEEVKKNIMEKKSPTDILIEKFKSVVEHFTCPNTLTAGDKDVNPTSKTDDANKINDNNSTSSVHGDKKRLPENKCNKNTTEMKNSQPKKKSVASSNTEKQIQNIKQLTTNVQDNVIKEARSDNATDKQSKKSDICNKLGEISNTSRGTVQESSKEVQNKQKTLTQTSITEFTASTDKLNPNKNLSKEVKAETLKKNSEANNSLSQNKSSTASETMIVEEYEDSEETDVIDDIQIDKNKIFSIIHSSLTEAKSKKPAEKATTVERSLTTSSMSHGKKRKAPSSDEDRDTYQTSQAKLVKLVPIESILNKSNDQDNGTETSLLQKSLQGKKPVPKPSSSSSTPLASNSRRSSIQEIVTENIKSEPETDDDFTESENLEAKKKYLSALNISEKVNESDKALLNEIRTRSKAEEKREKFKKLDNLSRIIDDVALNYSAKNASKKLPAQKPDAEKCPTNSQEGEIFVKSFAKITTCKPRARKSFPTPSYVKANMQTKVGTTTQNKISLLKRDLFQSSASPKKDLPKTNVPNANVALNSSATPTSQPQSTTINYSAALMNPMLNAVPSATSTTTTSPPQPVIYTLSKTKPAPPTLNVVASQNYIPQSERRNSNNTPTNRTVLQDILNTPGNPTRESDQAQETGSTSNSVPVVEATANATTTPQEEEFSVLNSILPESVSRAVSDLLLRGPPKLKPRPPGPLSTVFDEGIPSTAGNVTARINSVAHRLGDYFRGMLIETLEDLGKSSTPEAKITSLQMEIEALKHQHNVEMSEIRKNVCTVLQDIQKSLIEDRERIIDETRAACEAETIKRVEMAKSKQWCANCSKEAQFYCCWNTSYCDYPCQQKHWPQHVGKCTQNIEKGNSMGTPVSRPSGQQLILRPTLPTKPGMGRIVAKPTKVYMNRNTGPPKPFKVR
ncbi:hypothetical protein NQ315_004873 [Exocentrus adspersus]|uniref:Protein kinase C-binding protein 1 n=1 Tax=Exocentrus adspersus TaxID=1586481 RepID=A0AAV8W2M8_9CUCU|nr:hypothetical protein NQ315_004873 [Exocentrus adspersus]